MNQQNASVLTVVIVVALIVVAFALCLVYFPAIKWSYRTVKSIIKQHHADMHTKFDAPKA